jgi:hypothetical protein
MLRNIGKMKGREIIHKVMSTKESKTDMWGMESKIWAFPGNSSLRFPLYLSTSKKSCISAPTLSPGALLFILFFHPSCYFYFPL